MKDTLLMKVVVSVLLICLVACSPIIYHTFYSSQEDPLYDFTQVKRIGFLPYYWNEKAKGAGITELSEKQIYAYFKEELENKGYEVLYYPLGECVVQGDSVFLKQSVVNPPELTFTISFEQTTDSIEIPEQSLALLNWGSKSGSGSYGSSGSYYAKGWNLFISASFWSGDKYMTQVWLGQILKGSPSPSLWEEAPQMIQSLLSKEDFPKAKKK